MVIQQFHVEKKSDKAGTRIKTNLCHTQPYMVWCSETFMQLFQPILKLKEMKLKPQVELQINPYCY